MSKSPSYSYQFGDARVFWDISDYPLPNSVRAKQLRNEIQRVLSIEGYMSDLSVYSYLPDNPVDGTICELVHPDVDVEIRCFSDERKVRFTHILLDVLVWAKQNRREPENTICFIVAKDIEDANNKSEFANVVRYLVSKNFNVFMVVPTGTTKKELDVVAREASEVWTWDALLKGEYPLESDSESDSEEEESSTKRMGGPLSSTPDKKLG